jgi:cytochrome bd ubiquinol oxidase subunit II
MDTLAVGLVAFFGIGYFVLAGTDIGVGMLLPFLGPDRRRTLRAIMPFFLANEVWLVGTIGLLTALFPVVEGDVFGRVWGALIVLVAGWMVRDLGLWLRLGGPGPWDAAIVAGSWAVAASWGVAIGLLMGSWLFVVPTCALFALHGAVFAALRLGVPVARRIVPFALVAGVPCALGAGSGHLGRTVPLVAGLAVVLVLVWVALGTRRYGAALAASAVAIVAVPLSVRLPDLTVADDASLTVTVTSALLPLLIAAQAWVWWTFRGPVTRPA